MPEDPKKSWVTPQIRKIELNEEETRKLFFSGEKLAKRGIGVVPAKEKPDAKR